VGLSRFTPHLSFKKVWTRLCDSLKMLIHLQPRLDRGPDVLKYQKVLNIIRRLPSDPLLFAVWTFLPATLLVKAIVFPPQKGETPQMALSSFRLPFLDSQKSLPVKRRGDCPSSKARILYHKKDE